MKTQEKKHNNTMNKAKLGAKKILSLLKYVVVTLLCLLLVWGIIILRQINQPTDVITPIANQTPLQPSPDVTINDESQLPQLMATFPVPCMCLLSGSGAGQFASGTAVDFPLTDGVGRKISVKYTSDAGELTVESVYPVSANQQVNISQYTLTGDGSFTLAGIPASRWEKSNGVALTCQAEDAIYAVYWNGEGSIPDAMLQSLQLFQIMKN